MKEYIPFLQACLDGKHVQTRYRGDWADLNLEGLVRRVLNNSPVDHLRIVEEKVSPEKAMVALNQIADGAAYDGTIHKRSYDALSAFIRQHQG